MTDILSVHCVPASKKLDFKNHDQPFSGRIKKNEATLVAGPQSHLKHNDLFIRVLVSEV